MVVLDSDILIGILRGRGEAVSAMNKLEEHGHALRTTVINVHEILEGAFLHENNQESVRKVEILLRGLKVLAFTESAARISAHIASDLRKKGAVIDFQDIAIASVALANNEKVITRNEKHFSAIKSLKIETW